ELTEAGAAYRAVGEQIPAITYTLDPETRDLRYISPQVRALLGVEQQQWVDDREAWSRHLHPDDRDRVRQEWETAKQAGVGFRSEYRMVAANGGVLWFQDEARPIPGPGGRPLFIQGVMLD